MIRSKASKDSSRGFQVSSEISFLISVRKTLPTSGQSADVHAKFFAFPTKRPLTFFGVLDTHSNKFKRCVRPADAGGWMQRR